MASKRMRHLTDAEIVEKRTKYTLAATVRSNKNAHTIMLKYLEEIGVENNNCIHYPADELNAILCKFWFAIRKQKKDKPSKNSDIDFDNNETENDDNYLYSKATLENIRHALNCVIQEAGRPLDILSDQESIESNRCYRDACKELKAKGKAVVKSYPEIIHSGQFYVFKSKCYFHEIALSDLMSTQNSATDLS